MSQLSELLLVLIVKDELANRGDFSATCILLVSCCGRQLADPLDFGRWNGARAYCSINNGADRIADIYLRNLLRRSLPASGWLSVFYSKFVEDFIDSFIIDFSE